MTGRSPLGAAALAALLVAAASQPAAAQVDLSIQWLYPVETIYAADLSPYNVGGQPDFLSITLLNGAASPQNVVLELRVEQVEPTSAELFRGETDPFVLEGPRRRLTNRDLASRGRDVSVQDWEIGARAEELTERITETGRFPAGGYRFTVLVRTPDGVLLDRAELRRDLTNTTRLELIGPGAPFGEPPPVVSSPSPRFLWSTDSGVLPESGGEYELRVVPVGAAASPEEAMQNFAAWETTTPATTAVYPGSVSALRLEPGATYAWQVTREIRTSGGTEVLESPIYAFRVSGGAGEARVTRRGAAGRVGASRVLDELARALGMTDELEGFEPTGQVLVDGRPMSSEGLEALVRAVLAGEVTVRSVTLR